MMEKNEDLNATNLSKTTREEPQENTERLRSEVFEYTFPSEVTPRLKPHPLITFLIGLVALGLALFTVVAFTPYGLTVSDGQLAIAWHQTRRYHYIYSPNSNIQWVAVDTSELLWIKIRPILLCLSLLMVALWLKHLNLHPVVVRGFDLRGRTLRTYYLHGPSKVFQIPSWARARVEHSPYDPQDSPHHDPSRYSLGAIGPFFLQIDTTASYYGVNLGTSMKKSELKVLASEINAYLDAQESPSSHESKLSRHRH